SSRVEKVLNKMDGVDAQVNLTTETATVDFDPSQTPIDEITDKIEKLGYGVQTEQTELDVFGMTCAACATRIEKVLHKQQVIERASVNEANETATLEYNPALIEADDIIDKIKALGYDAKQRVDAEGNESYNDKELKQMKTKVIISAILSIPLLITMSDHLFGFRLPDIFMNPWFQFALATHVQFVIGWQFYVDAYNNIRTKSANMDVLD